MIKRAISLVLLACTASAAAQQPPPPPVAVRIASPLIVPSRTVNLRLDPHLGKAVAGVREALAGLPAQVAEPADYKITTERAFPQTLIAIDLRQVPDNWDENFDPPDGDPRPEPRTFELGNLVLGDYLARLRDLITRVAKTKSVLALQSPASAETDTCFGWTKFDAEGTASYACRRTDTYDRDQEEPFGDQFAAGVTNRAATPQYVALLSVEPFLGIQRLQLNTADPAAPLAPGATVRTKVSQLLNSRSEIVYLVTIASDRPIDTSSLEQSTVEDNTLGCPNGVSDCTFSPLKADDHWKVSVADYRVHRDVVAALGGAISVLDGMAQWMAEFYSTVPYTKEEIAADAKKPQDEREFLADRSGNELAHRCGASLIAPNLVLTAAHCVATGKYAGTDGMKRVLDERRVRVGTMYLGRGGTTYAIAGVAVPSSYSPNKQDNDIALLLIRPDRDTQPMKLPIIALGRRPLAGGTPLAALGWGYTGEVAAHANPLFNIARELQHNPTHLQVGVMNTLNQTRCRQRLGDHYANAMLCMISPPPPTDDPDRVVFSCRGDSGGPLVRNFGKRDELVGLTSWSMGCGHNGYPSVYTDVTKFGSWIAAARRQLKSGAAIIVADPAAPAPGTVRRH